MPWLVVWYWIPSRWIRLLLRIWYILIPLHREASNWRSQHADILSDLAAALAGSIGIAPTSNLDPTRKNPSMFEPIHGSAFDITGKGVANPVATFWTASEMMIWLGEEDAAKKLMDSVEAVTERGIRTRDLGGSAGTKEVTEAVCAELENRYRSTTKQDWVQLSMFFSSIELLRSIPSGLLPANYLFTNAISGDGGDWRESTKPGSFSVYSWEKRLIDRYINQRSFWELQSIRLWLRWQWWRRGWWNSRSG